jgi:hypothetical protein
MTLSRTTGALIVKFIVTLVASAIAFSPWGASWVIIVALMGTVLNYLLGDLMLLPRYGNFTATIGDGLLAMATAYILGLLSRSFNPRFSSLLLFGIVVAVAEYFAPFFYKSFDL